MSVVEPAPKKWTPLVRWLITGIGLALFLVLAVTVFWRLAAHKSEEIIDAWVARERAVGRVWTCPQRTVAGYPFSIEISCAKPHFEGLIFARHFSGSLSGFRARAELLHPTRVTVAMAPPFAAHSKDSGVNLHIGWGDLQVILSGLPVDQWQVSIKGSDIVSRGALEGLGSVAGKVSQATADASQRPDQADHAVDFHIALAGASLPLVESLLGPGSAADIEAQGTVTKAGLNPALSMPDNAEHWRIAGGHLELTDASLSHGETKMSARGMLGLDEAHQVQGQLATESQGFEPLLRRFGIDPMIVSAGALLNSLLGGAPPGDAAPKQENLRLTVGFQGGRLYVGPVRTTIRVPPLY